MDLHERKRRGLALFVPNYTHQSYVGSATALSDILCNSYTVVLSDNSPDSLGQLSSDNPDVAMV